MHLTGRWRTPKWILRAFALPNPHYAGAQMVPKGVFPCITKLRQLDMSHNSLKSLPDDMGELT